MNSTSIIRSLVCRADHHASLAVWRTGLRSAGKTTIAEAVETHLSQQGLNIALLDGDGARKATHNRPRLQASESPEQ